jgi:hypothetical protein
MGYKKYWQKTSKKSWISDKSFLIDDSCGHTGIRKSVKQGMMQAHLTRRKSRPNNLNGNKYQKLDNPNHKYFIQKPYHTYIQS